MTVLTILQRFEFEPGLLRSGVIVSDSAGPPDEMLFFVRGAPAAIEQLINRASTPQTYRQVCSPCHSIIHAPGRRMQYTGVRLNDMSMATVHKGVLGHCQLV